MSAPLTQSQIDDILALDAEKRFKYLVKEVVSNREIWILTDEHGCVMLNTDEEDGVPVWPNKEFAELWATGEWEECKAEAISLNKWHSRWTYGLEDDELAVVIFPDQSEEGLVISPEELDFELKQQARK
ncbi:phage-shock protein [Photobacterium aquae]|uniref:Phage-shock protein n=1 Tax=Photobacterium aquae TaxID=1195763 RepID=A0A0J1H575_9GAMM|nr:DUF2750 domain-containing protein [Photobacterium aquae]KLV06934.1 phage-shock protein [Photobacterium aquae]